MATYKVLYSMTIESDSAENAALQAQIEVTDGLHNPEVKEVAPKETRESKYYDKAITEPIAFLERVTRYLTTQAGRKKLGEFSGPTGAAISATVGTVGFAMAQIAENQ